MQSPLVSIITPTYNHSKYIGQCIESVLAQSFTNWEMIIVNDGSIDDTVEQVKKYLEGSNKIHLINQENIGVFRLGETYNKALAVSNGIYIAILEGDDVWEPDKLMRQVEAMEKNESIVLAWGRAQLTNDNLTNVYYEAPDTKSDRDLYNNTPNGAILDLYIMGQFIPAVTILIRKTFLEKIGGFIQTLNTPLIDFTTIVELSQFGKFYFDDHLLGKWRIYATQTTKKYTVEIYEGIKRFLSDHLSRVANLDDAKRDLVLNHYDQKCMIAYARSGRYKLVRKEYKSARQDYLRAITYPVNGNMIWRLRSAIGYAVSLVHLDVEWIARLLRRKTYSN